MTHVVQIENLRVESDVDVPKFKILVEVNSSESYTIVEAPKSIEKPMVKSLNEGKSKNVWVIHGRNGQLKDAVFQFLHAIELHPIEWTEARALTGSGSPYIGDILEYGFDYAQAFVVLLTGDDEAKLREIYLEQSDPEDERNLTPQARLNVIFEAGMAFGRDPDRVIFIQMGKVRQFSNISGIHVLHLNNSREKRMEFANRLKTAGCNILDLTLSLDWIEEGNFEPSATEQSNPA